mgnify:CR=1 FL=1
MIEKIKAIREKTDASLALIKEALEEAGGDEKKALEILKQKGIAKASKKKDRELKAGLIDSYVHLGKVGVLIEVLTETDFVAKNEKFHAFVHNLCMQIASTNPKNIDELLKQEYIKDESQTIKNLLDQTISTIGENIEIKNFTRYSLGG